MPDIATISSFLTSIKTASDIAKILKDSELSLETAETKMKLAELINALADAKIDAAGIRELLIEKDQKISELGEELKIKGSLKYEEPYYWLTQENGRDGPSCQKCYDTEKSLIRLQGDGEGYWDCRNCQNGYTDSSFNSGKYTSFEPTDF